MAKVVSIDEAGRGSEVEEEAEGNEEVGEANRQARARAPVPRRPHRHRPRHLTPHRSDGDVLVLGSARPIQDAMGWLDYRVHEFPLLDAKEGTSGRVYRHFHRRRPGRPPVVPGWQVPLSTFFDQRNRHARPAMYVYDFGDKWKHVLLHEGFESAEADRTFPRCLVGESRCLPENCGVVHGSEDILRLLPFQTMRSTSRRLDGPVDTSTRKRSPPSR